ncbi:hypothetical protein LCGC14_1343620 [marine sediment metagenome]|uniref:Uncharacterized protein n=1 Tax=marine sediment metagenome TaxID=412755 RepID=A0A0F9MTT5_9ZZZZ
MKETGLIFSTDMVKAIQDGRKTQTRRIIKPQPHEEEYLEVGNFTPALIDKDGEMYPADYQIFGAYTSDGELTWKCPYGQVGDRLWVRETFAIGSYTHKKWAEIHYKAGGSLLIFKGWNDWLEKNTQYGGSTVGDGDKWRSSRFIPKWASRITLEITEVRVERLNQITEEDAIAEGAIVKHSEDTDEAGYSFRLGFIDLWDSLNAKRGDWASNPWVWVISFKVFDDSR